MSRHLLWLCQCWFSQGGDQGTGLVASLTKEVVKNKDEIVKTASSALNLNVSWKPFLQNQNQLRYTNTQAAQTETMSKVFGMFGEGKDGTHVSKDKLGDVLRLTVVHMLEGGCFILQNINRQHGKGD